MAPDDPDDARFAPLKTRLATSLATDGACLSDADWHLLVALGYTRQWANELEALKRVGHFQAISTFLGRLRARDHELGRQQHAVPLAEQPEPESLEGGNRTEQQYAVILSHATAVQASAAAQPFRATYFGGRTLTEAQARALLDSPLVRLWGRAHFKAEGIPLVGHRVADITVRAGRSPAARVRLRVRGGARAKVIAFDGPTYFTTTSTAWVEIPGPPPSMDPRRVPVLRGSVLHELGKASAALARRFFWSEAAGAWFTLTGQYPTAPAVAARLRRTADGSRATITLEVLPFTSPPAVARAFKRMRQRIAGTRAARRPSSRRVRLLTFMAKNGSERVSPTLYKKFIAAHPGDRYEGGWRNAARDARTETVLLSGRPVPRKTSKQKRKAKTKRKQAKRRATWGLRLISA